MTENVSVSDIASMLMQPEPEIESTGDAEEAQAIDEPSEAEDYELEAEQDGTPEEVEDEDSEPEYFSVKVDGEELEVTLEEALRGYQRDADYRKKTMALSDDRKAFESSKTALDQKLQELDSYIKREEETRLTDELMTENPGEYLRLQKELAAKKEALDKAQSERNAELEKQRADLVAAETQRLTEIMGGNDWTQEQRNKDMAKATKYLESIGVSEAEYNSFVDHRVWRMVFDAAKAQEMNSVRSKVKEEVRKAPKSVKPGQKVPPSERKRQRATENLKSSNKHNAAGALAELLKTYD